MASRVLLNWSANAAPSPRQVNRIPTFLLQNPAARAGPRLSYTKPETVRRDGSNEVTWAFNESLLALLFTHHRFLLNRSRARARPIRKFPAAPWHHKRRQAPAGEHHGGRAGLATSNRCNPLGHAHRRQVAQRPGVNRFELPHKFVGAERRQFGAVITLILNGGGRMCYD